MFASERDSRLETAAVLAIVRRGGHPWHAYSEMIEERGSALSLLTEPESAQGTLFGAIPVGTADLQTTRDEIDGWEREGMRLVTVLDREYPLNLRGIFNRPPFLFVRGAFDEGDERSVAIVGTRKPTAAGRKLAAAYADVLADAGYVIVSGLAAGIDATAHTRALTRGMRTVAVIGTGLRRSYPAENAELQGRIAREGAVLSQFWPDASPTRKSFPMRNVTMSGFALGTVVVEAAERSGARMQARFALEHGRPVFLPESMLSVPWAAEYARRPGVHVLGDPDQLPGLLRALTEPTLIAL